MVEAPDVRGPCRLFRVVPALTAALLERWDKVRPVEGEDGAGSSLKWVRPSVTIFVSLAGVSAALTLLFLSMRSVMEIGGACASGQTPFVISHPCPKGVPLLMIGGVWGGLIFAGIYAWQSISRGLPSFVGLLWPALFLSLGWNFLEFGINPPGTGGLAWGWLVCAVLFIIMGGVPLIFVLPAMVRGREDTSSTASWKRAMIPAGVIPAAISAAASLRRATVSTSEEPEDLVSMLERLDALHRTGALDDQEYERAKDEILRKRGGA
jgi:hypothetical protein